MFFQLCNCQTLSDREVLRLPGCKSIFSIAMQIFNIRDVLMLIFQCAEYMTCRDVVFFSLCTGWALRAAQAEDAMLQLSLWGWIDRPHKPWAETENNEKQLKFILSSQWFPEFLFLLHLSKTIGVIFVFLIFLCQFCYSSSDCKDMSVSLCKGQRRRSPISADGTLRYWEFLWQNASWKQIHEHVEAICILFDLIYDISRQVHSVCRIKI